MVLSSVYYKEILSCQIDGPSQQMLIYSIVGFGIFSLIMSIMFFAGFISCIAFMCESRRLRREMENAEGEPIEIGHFNEEELN